VAIISDILRAENVGKRARQYVDLLDRRDSGIAVKNDRHGGN
jgi:hypothetical protein